MSIDTQSLRRRPPPRPPKSQHLLVEEAELRSFKQAASRSSSVPYPKGKNPFGESSDEEESAENIPSPPLEYSSPVKVGANPFDGFVSEDKLEKTKLAETVLMSESPQVAVNEELQGGRLSVPDFESTGEHDVDESIGDIAPHVVDSQTFPNASSLPPTSPNVFSVGKEEQLKAGKAPQPQGSSPEKQTPPKPRKRPAPKPPVLRSTGGLSRDQGMCLPLQVVNDVVASSPLSRELSTSCGNVRAKGPAPPQPVGYKREIRTEGFVKYPKLRREIEEVNGRLSQIDGEIASLNEKIDNIKDDTAKITKYTKKLTKLMEKREAVSDKYRQLTNRLQEQVLEECQADLEFELRNILAKQEHLRTEEEQARSEELLKLLVEIVQDRDKLVEEGKSPENSQQTIYSSLPKTESEINGHQPEDVVRSD